MVNPHFKPETLVSALTVKLTLIPIHKVISQSGTPKTDLLMARQKDAEYYAKAADCVKKNSTCILPCLERIVKLYDQVVYPDLPQTKDDLGRILTKLTDIQDYLKLKPGIALARLEREGKTETVEYDAVFGLDHHVKSTLTGPFAALETLVSNDLDASQKQKQVNIIQEKVNGILELRELLMTINSDNVARLLDSDNHFSGPRPDLSR